MKSIIISIILLLSFQLYSKTCLVNNYAMKYELKEDDFYKYIIIGDVIFWTEKKNWTTLFKGTGQQVKFYCRSTRIENDGSYYQVNIKAVKIQFGWSLLILDNNVILVPLNDLYSYTQSVSETIEVIINEDLK